MSESLGVYYLKYHYFNVIGAGQIRITEENNVSCGNSKGFSFDVEWGKHGFTGGVLPKGEAIKLAEHILRNVNDDQTEDVEIKVEISKLLEEIKLKEERIEEIREICKHKEFHRGDFMTEGGHIKVVDVCDYCGKIMFE